MSETTTADIRAGFIEYGLGDGSHIDQDDVRALNAREFDEWFDRMIAEVERAAAEKAYEQGRLDERHDCNRYAEYQQGKITEEQYQRDVRSRNPYRAEAYRREVTE